MSENTNTSAASEVASSEASGSIDIASPGASSAPTTWFDSLPDDLKNEGSLESFKGKDITDVVKSYVEAQKTIGGMVRIPSEDAPAEIKDKFYQKLSAIPDVVKLPKPDDAEGIANLMNKLGRPEKAENYSIPEIPEHALGVMKPEAINEFKEFAHKLGLTDAQSKSLMEYEISKTTENLDKMVAKIESNKATLQKMWGQDFENRANSAKAMLDTLGRKYPELVEEFNQNHETNPLVYEVLSELAQVYRERGHISGSNVGKFGLTPSEANAKIQEMRADLNGPLYNSSHPEHEAAMERLNELYKLTSPR